MGGLSPDYSARYDHAGMTETPTPVLTYEPSRPKRARWIWFAAGLLCGALVVAVVLPAVNRFREARNRVQVRSNLRQIGLALAMYSTDGGTSFPQGSGTLHVSANSIGLPYGKFIFLAEGRDVVALRMDCPSG